MSFRLDVRHNLKELKREVSLLQRRHIPKATTIALNRTAKNVESKVVRELSGAMGMTQKAIRPSLRVFRANKSTLEAVVFARGRPFNLIRFKARKTKKGVSAAPWNDRKIFKSTFIANQGRTVFVRKGKARLPIRPVFGPGIGTEFTRTTMERVLRKEARERFPKHFRQAIRAASLGKIR